MVGLAFLLQSKLWLFKYSYSSFVLQKAVGRIAVFGAAHRSLQEGTGEWTPISTYWVAVSALCCCHGKPGHPVCRLLPPPAAVEVDREHTLFSQRTRCEWNPNLLWGCVDFSDISKRQSRNALFQRSFLLIRGKHFMLTHFNCLCFQCYGILTSAILILLFNILMTSMAFQIFPRNLHCANFFVLQILNENKFWTRNLTAKIKYIAGSDVYRLAVRLGETPLTSEE